MIVSNSPKRGSVAVEFALIAPILMALFAATADLGTAIERSIRLQTISRAGANYAALIPSDTGNSAASKMSNLLTDLPGASATVAISCKCPTSTASATGPAADCSTVCPAGMATYVTINVSAPFAPIFPLSPLIPFTAIGATSAQIVLRVS